MGGLYLKQARERITVAPSVLAHSFIEGVVGLVARRGTCKTLHRSTLRTEECGGPVRKGESRLFFLHHSHLCIALGVDEILECHVVVRDVHHKVEYRIAVLGKGNGHLRSLMADMASLDVAELIIHIYSLLCLSLSHFQPGCIVGEVEDKSQR